MENILQQLIEYLKALSPQVWEILVRQAYVEAVFFIMLGLGCKGIVVAGNKFYIEEVEETGNGHLTRILQIFFGLVGLFFFGNALGRLINPEFYALQYILKQLGGT